MFLDALRVGMLLCDLPTPALVLDVSTARRGLSDADIEAALNGGGRRGGASDALQDLVYVHSSVRVGRDPAAGAVGLTTVQGGGYTEYVTLAQLDCTSEQAGGAGSFVCLGLNNHYTPGYYWGNSVGTGAAEPAPGVALRAEGAGRPLLLERVANTNDGKLSEWCEFLRHGDQISIVPASPAALLAAGPLDVLVGVRRVGEGVPPGAEPKVGAAWRRDEASGRWGRLDL